ncbi:hypothetical protein, variant [Verruconis gallopava]|nr:hypothetical protein, variant [Verruconis gallopava]KIW06475.1 hypothetical protein, variant [Verruconis gallopava]
MNRQMPPPSPSQQAPTGPAFQQGPRGPPPPTFATGRELPGLGTRGPGAGMSISSILGDVPSQSQPPPPPSHSHRGSPAGTSQSPPSLSQQPVSPHKRGHSTASKLSDYQWRRPQTPERHHLPAGLRNDGLSYSANSSPAQFAGVKRSPEFARSGPPLFHHAYQSAGPAPRAYQGSPNEAHERDPPRKVDERMPPRPNSQPAGGVRPPPGDGASREPMPPFGGAINRPPFTQYHPQERRDDPRPPTTTSFEVGPTTRDRPVTVEPLGHSYSPRNNARDASAAASSSAREGPKDEPRRDIGGREDHSAPFRTSFRSQYYQPRGAIPPPEAPRSHPQMGNPFERPRDGQSTFGPHERASIDPLARDDRRTSDPHGHPGEAQFRVLQEHQPLMMQRSRSSLGIEGKRGRASPLPQAVQGAQMQPTGAGSDPNIKSEFGRIFQGLGSGIGPGHMTPSRGSPMPQRQPPSNLDGETVTVSDGEAPRSGSFSKRHKRVKEEDLSRYDDEGRGTPLSRAGKRHKQGHHHHIHQHNHPHHHHVHGHVHNRPEESIGIVGSTSTTAHHHHHIHTSHHHHHTPLSSRPQAQTPAMPIPKPAVHVSSQAVFDAVKDRSRRHLGSELYEPTIALPPNAMASHTDDKFGYFLRYKPSRVFEDVDLNCTFTVRVPRYYLTKEARENVQRNRALVGTGIYTDDSDPLAMLVHEGWLRGEWPEEVDVEMMDLPVPPAEDAVVQEVYTSRPAVPLLPPEGKDLHITLLILPRLKKYTGSVRYGLRSRDWEVGDTHDGLSWALHTIRWIDEGPSSGLKRSGKARRERIESLRKEAALGLIGLMDAGVAGPVAVA